MNIRTIVILPTYDEQESVAGIIRRIRRSVPEAHVLVVDDNSPDGTGDVAEEISRSDVHVHVLHRARKQGLGAAYLAGFTWAVSDGYDAIVECDADGSHHPEELSRLLDALEVQDMVIGSRWIAGGAVVGWPLSRRWLSRAGSGYARMLLGLPQRDVTGGFRAYRAAALQSLMDAGIASEGYCFQIELLWRAQRAGLRIAEVPITFSDRQLGSSKMNAGIVAEAMWRVTRWAFGARLRRPVRVAEVRHV